MTGYASALFFVLAATAASAQLHIGPESLISTDEIVRPAGWVAHPTVATDGAGFLGVWADARSDAGPTRELYASRVDADGNPLDPLGIRVTSWPADRFDFAIAYDGSHYLVLDQSLTATELDRSGAIVGVHENGVNGVALNVRMTWTGSSYAAAWGRGEAHFALFTPSGVLVSSVATLAGANPNAGADVQDMASNSNVTIIIAMRDGHMDEHVLDRRGILVATRTIAEHAEGPVLQTSPYRTAAIATDGNQFLAVWRDPVAYAVSAQLLNAAGEPVGAPVIIARSNTFTTAPALPVVTWDGTQYVVAYQRCDFYKRLVAHRAVDRSGAPFSSEQIDVDLTGIDLGAREFSIASNRAGRTLFFGITDDLYARPLGPGALHPIRSSRTQDEFPSVAMSDGTTMITWRRKSDSPARARFASSLAFDNPFDIITPADPPHVTAGATTFLVTVGSTYDLFDRDRTLIVNGEVPQTTVPTTITAAWTGEGYLIPASSGSLFFMTERGDIATVQSLNPVVRLAPNKPPPSMACNGITCVLARITWSNFPCFRCSFVPQIEVTRFSSRGRMIDAQPHVTPADTETATVAVAPLDNDFLLVWRSKTAINAAIVPESGGYPSEPLAVIATLPEYIETSLMLYSDGRTAILAYWDWPTSDQIWLVPIARSAVALSVDKPHRVLEQPSLVHGVSLAESNGRFVIAYDRLSLERGVPALFLRDVWFDRRHSARH